MLIPSIMAKMILHRSKSHEDQEARETCIIGRDFDLMCHYQRTKMNHIKRDKKKGRKKRKM
jgi:hypothetical protein